MRKPVSSSALGIALLLQAGGLFAQSYSYSSEFVLPEEFPLQHVYIGIQQPSGHDGAMLPRELDPTFGPEGVRPPGFEVPVGDSSFDLVSVHADLAVPHLSQWAVMGLYTDGYGNEHVVLGTNADLAGVELCSQELLGAGSLTCSDDYIIEVLKTGSLLGEGSGIAGAILNPMRENDLMLDWGERSQLFFFSEGQAIPGAFVEAAELALVPEPPTELEARQVWLSDQVDLRWRDNSHNESGFRIQYVAYPSPDVSWKSLAEVGAGVREYRTDETVLGRRYVFRVGAFNEAGPSEWSNEADVHVAYWQAAVVWIPIVLIVVILVLWRIWVVRRD